MQTWNYTKHKHIKQEEKNGFHTRTVFVFVHQGETAARPTTAELAEANAKNEDEVEVMMMKIMMTIL